MIATPQRRKQWAAAFSIGSNGVLVALKIVVGLFTGSIGILSEAIHSGIDLLASIMALVAINQASKPADAGHAYGHGKIENLSGSVEAALILVAAILIVLEAVTRIRAHAPAPQVDLGLAVMTYSCLQNWFVSRYLLKVARETGSPALEADGHHLSTDVLTGLGVLAGLVLVHVTGRSEFDAITALGVAVLIARLAWSVTRTSVADLLDASLPDGELAVIEGILQARIPPLLDYHDLRTRRSGNQRHVDVHLTFPAHMLVGEAHAVAHGLELAIAQALPGSLVLTHLDSGEIDQRTGELRRSP